MPDTDNLYLTLIEQCDGCAPRGEGVEYVATGKEPWYGTWKLNPSKSHYVNGFQRKDGIRTTLSTATISADGKTRIVRQTGAQVGGRDVNNTLVYERQ